MVMCRARPGNHIFRGRQAVSFLLLPDRRNAESDSSLPLPPTYNQSCYPHTLQFLLLPKLSKFRLWLSSQSSSRSTMQLSEWTTNANTAPSRPPPPPATNSKPMNPFLFTLAITPLSHTTAYTEYRLTASVFFRFNANTIL